MPGLQVLLPVAFALAVAYVALVDTDPIPIFDAARMRPSAPGATFTPVPPLTTLRHGPVTPIGMDPNDPPAEQFTHMLDL